MNDRPEYRTLYATFADDADVHALSGRAFKALVLLKLSLPVTGVGVIYPSKLSDQVGCEKAELYEALGELEAPKPGRDRGWIMRDRNIVWVVNAFACEPGMTPANTNHVKFVRKLLAGIDQQSPVLAGFKERYPQWFHEDAKPIRKASPRHRNPIGNVSSSHPEAERSAGIPSESHPDPTDSTLHTTTSGGSSKISSPSGLLGSSPAAASAPPAPHFASLSDLLAASGDIARFCRTYYRGAEPARKADVGRQLLEALNGGTLLRGQRVQAYSLERLEAKCREVLSEDVRNGDKAIVVLLAKLADTSDGSAPGAQQAAAERETREQDEATTAEDLVKAEVWLRAHPEAELRIDSELQHDGFVRGGDGDSIELGWRIARRWYLLRAWRARLDADDTS